MTWNNPENVTRQILIFYIYLSLSLSLSVSLSYLYLSCFFPFFYSKAPLISCLEKKLPRSILFKRKLGFQTPYKKWMHDLNRNKAKTTGLIGWMNFVSDIY